MPSSRSASDSLPNQCTKTELKRSTSEIVSPLCSTTSPGPGRKVPPLSRSAGTASTTKPDLASPRRSMSSRTSSRLCFTASGEITERPLVRANSICGETAVASPRPQRPGGLTRTGVSERETDGSKLNGLLQKLRDPSCRNLMSTLDMKNADGGEDDDKAPLPVKGRLMSRFLQPSKRMNTLIED